MSIYVYNITVDKKLMVSQKNISNVICHFINSFLKVYDENVGILKYSNIKTTAIYSNKLMLCFICYFDSISCISNYIRENNLLKNKTKNSLWNLMLVKNICSFSSLHSRFDRNRFKSSYNSDSQTFVTCIQPNRKMFQNFTLFDLNCDIFLPPVKLIGHRWKCSSRLQLTQAQTNQRERRFKNPR
jgi:hypothetical protein